MKQPTAGADPAKTSTGFRVNPLNPGLTDDFRAWRDEPYARYLAESDEEEPNAGNFAERRTKKTQMRREYVTAIRELPTPEG